MDKDLTTLTTRIAPIVRTNLSRFAIYLDVPPAIAALIIDIVDLLPDPDIKSFLRQLAAAPGGADLSHTPAQFLHWLLLDPVHGAINLSKRDDVKDSIRSVAADVLDPMAKGRTVDVMSTKPALFQAQVAQLKAWHDYEFRSAIDGLQPRIEWMIATAATDALSPYRPEQLVGAVHSCSVAWSSALQDQALALPSVRLQLAIRDKLLELLAPQQPTAPAQHRARFDKVGQGSRVEFDDPQEGPQRGTVLGVINSTEAPATAVVLVDHSMAGMTWNVPLSKLTPLEEAAA